jgi:predicted TIM-barrel fold metal-dependent hydrolase
MAESDADRERREAEAILFATDDAWLAGVKEEILEREMPIIDPHHHLWDRGVRYLLEEILADVMSGHNIVATCYVDCESMYRKGVDKAMAPVGEVEFANGVAAMAASGTYPGAPLICHGIIGYADCFLGERIDAVLETQLERAGPRFKGIRNCTPWDADSSIRTTPIVMPPHMLIDDQFRKGVSRLEKYGLTFDGWLLHPQIPEFADLARRNPGVTMILNHIGAPLGVGVYEGRSEEVFKDWRAKLTELAKCENVMVKIGGMGMHVMAFGFDHGEQPPTSEQLAVAWSPYVHTVIDLFGPGRCMFESNFPPDKRSVSYHVLWNGFKRIAKDYSSDENAALFHDVAARVYRLDVNQKRKGTSLHLENS